MAQQINDLSFHHEVLEAKSPVLVDFWAAWCGPCKVMEPVIDELAKEMDGRARVVKLNVDENPDSGSRYGVMSIPTFLIFKNGQVVDQAIGVVHKGVLKEKLDKLL